MSYINTLYSFPSLLFPTHRLHRKHTPRMEQRGAKGVLGVSVLFDSEERSQMHLFFHHHQTPTEYQLHENKLALYLNAIDFNLLELLV